ncbi:MAG TPA: GNAT family N-acetyltransferase [Rhodocyclaceae bacterium]|nr:GNAT family N-acetyltransferase [Rhodocyclaceae bacterium]HNA04935.1 GNAT family N-acetyltransferase [Rhodocyclaceae bacterium]HNB79923.1 GNAT family N-acetyltransferase [Rhodocyclaceae bacterium]HNC62315.1 GNAT family N-acetyltransferase [Rhodocyclaceae bacterium]HNH14497.1 GNAT family N-acetyltransferase [Rhodocyclaceae bacterium]
MAEYPHELVCPVVLRDGAALTIRPIRAEDAEMEQDFIRGLSEHTRYLRFMSTITELPPHKLRDFTDIDYDHHMALVATRRDGEQEIQLGVARYAVGERGDSTDECEFAVTVTDDWQGRGVGTHLMLALIEAARKRGLRRMAGIVLATNQRMLELARKLGFVVGENGESETVRVTLELAPLPEAA